MDAETRERNAHIEGQRPLLFLWSVGGVLLLLFQALFRLSQIASEALLSGEMTPNQWIACGAWMLSNAYLEGYRGFQKRFVPRVISRAHYLSCRPGTAPLLLAPLFSMAYFKANKRALASAWGVTLLVVCAIVLIRAVPQPWRGIIDAGVVVGLGWGTVVLAWSMLQVLQGQKPTAPPDLPPSA